MYKMEINVSGQRRVFLFRGPGCRKAMLEWWRDHLLRAEAGADVRNIRVWGTVGNKTDIVLEWPPARIAPEPPNGMDLSLMEGERELTTGLLSKDARFRLIVNGKIGVKEIEMLIKKLELDKEVLAEQDENGNPE
jgi:hypothetical protein